MDRPWKALENIYKLYIHVTHNLQLYRMKTLSVYVLFWVFQGGLNRDMATVDSAQYTGESPLFFKLLNGVSCVVSFWR